MSNQANQNTKKNTINGRWTNSQCQRFLKAYQKYGRDWTEVAKIVKTRTLTQVRSHAQKVLQKMYQNGLDPESEIQNSDQISYHDESQDQQSSQLIIRNRYKKITYKKQQQQKQNPKQIAPLSYNHKSNSSSERAKKRRCSLETKQTISNKPNTPELAHYNINTNLSLIDSNKNTIPLRLQKEKNTQKIQDINQKVLKSFQPCLPTYCNSICEILPQVPQVSFPSREIIRKYIQQNNNPCMMLQCVLLNWDHFASGGSFLDLYYKQ